MADKENRKPEKEKSGKEEELRRELARRQMLLKYYRQHPEDNDAFLALASSSARAIELLQNVTAQKTMITGMALSLVPVTGPIAGAAYQLAAQAKLANDIRIISADIVNYGAKGATKSFDTKENKDALINGYSAILSNDRTLTDTDLKLLEALMDKRLEKTDERMEQGFERLSSEIAGLSQQLQPCRTLAGSLLDRFDASDDTPVAEQIYASFAEVCTDTVEKCYGSLEARGDTAKYRKELELKLFGPGIWKRLDPQTQKALVTAKTVYDTLSDREEELDYSGVCALVSKALEIECRKYFFSRFREYIKSMKDRPRDIPDEQAEALGLVARAPNFTLGNMCFILPPFDWDPQEYAKVPEKYHGYQSVLISYGRERLFSESRRIDLTDDEAILNVLKEYGSDINTVRKNYRNPSVHNTSMSQQSALDCLDFVVDVEKILKKMVGSFRE